MQGEGQLVVVCKFKLISSSETQDGKHQSLKLEIFSLEISITSLTAKGNKNEKNLRTSLNQPFLPEALSLLESNTTTWT